MTDIEAKALALVNDFSPYECDNIADANHLTLIKSLRQSIEREEATEARHAAELREQAEKFSEAVRYCIGQGMAGHHRETLEQFILPAPDPLKSWMHKSGYEGNSVVEQALADLAQNGGKIVWEAGE